MVVVVVVMVATLMPIPLPIIVTTRIIIRFTAGTWLAKWEDSINGETKVRARAGSVMCVSDFRRVTGVSVQFIYLAASSSLKGVLSPGPALVML